MKSSIDEADRLFEPLHQHAREAHEDHDLADRRESLEQQRRADQEDRSSVIVVEARVATATTAHQDSTGICALSRRSTTLRSAGRFRLDAHIALHQRDIAERVGGALREIRERRSTFGLHLVRLASTMAVSTANTTHRMISRIASRQFRDTDR